MDKGEKQRREEHKKRLDELRKKHHKKVRYYENKPYVSEEEFYHMTKEFFLELLQKEYEPTYEELIEELEDVDHEFLNFSNDQRRAVKDLLTRLSEAHYSNSKLTNEESQEVLAAFREVVRDLTDGADHSIDKVLHRGLLALRENDLDAAKQEYKRARTIFDKLSDQEQEQYYDQLNKLFSALS